LLDSLLQETRLASLFAMSGSSSIASLPTLQAWLADLLPEVPDWEVTPDTTEVLSQLYELNMRLEKDSLAEIENLEQTAMEYQAETNRCRGMLARVGQGVDTSFSQGPAQAYCEVITSLCSSLNLDTSSTVGIETSVADLLKLQAEGGPEVGRVKGEVERIRSDIVQLYERLARLEEVVKMADKEEKEESSVAGDKNKKLEYLVAKLADYRRGLERGEGVLARNGGNDESIRHAEILKLNKELLKLESECEPLSRQLQGYLALPPSKELAKVELASREEELEKLEKEVAGEISCLRV